MHITPHRSAAGWMGGNRRPPPCHHPSIDPPASHAKEAGSDPRNPHADADRRIDPSVPVPVPTHGKMVPELTSQRQITVANCKRTAAIEVTGDADPPGVAERVRARILPDARVRPEDRPSCRSPPPCRMQESPKPTSVPFPQAIGAGRTTPRPCNKHPGAAPATGGVGTERNVPPSFLPGGTSSVRPSASAAAGVASVRVRFRPPTCRRPRDVSVPPPRIPATRSAPQPGNHGASPSSASRPRSGPRPHPVPTSRAEIRAVAPSGRVSIEARATGTASAELIPTVGWRRPR